MSKCASVGCPNKIGLINNDNFCSKCLLRENEVPKEDKKLSSLVLEEIEKLKKINKEEELAANLAENVIEIERKTIKLQKEELERLRKIRK